MDGTIIGVVAAVLLSAVAPGVDAAQPPSALSRLEPSQAARPVGPHSSQACQKLGTSAAGSGEAGPTRTDKAGGVTVRATYCGVLADGKLGFAVALDTHSVALDDYPIEARAFLRLETGPLVPALAWEAPSGGGHHRSGVLLFPAADAAGQPVIGTKTGAVELVLPDLGGVQEHVFKWEFRRGEVLAK